MNSVPLIRDVDVPQPTDAFEATTQEPSLTLTRTSDGSTYQLNSSASYIWALVDGATSVGAMIDELAAGADVDRSQIAADVVTALRWFADLGVIRLRED